MYGRGRRPRAHLGLLKLLPQTLELVAVDPEREVGQQVEGAHEALLALSGGGAFFVAYLLKAGVPVPGVLGALALILAGVALATGSVRLASLRAGRAEAREAA